MIAEKRMKPQYLLNNTMPTIMAFDDCILVMSDVNFGRKMLGGLCGMSQIIFFFFFFPIFMLSPEMDEVPVTRTLRPFMRSVSVGKAGKEPEVPGDMVSESESPTREAGPGPQTQSQGSNGIKHCLL